MLAKITTVDIMPFDIIYHICLLQVYIIPSSPFEMPLITISNYSSVDPAIVRIFEARSDVGFALTIPYRGVKTTNVDFTDVRFAIEPRILLTDSLGRKILGETNTFQSPVLTWYDVSAPGIYYLGDIGVGGAKYGRNMRVFRKALYTPFRG